MEVVLGDVERGEGRGMLRVAVVRVAHVRVAVAVARQVRVAVAVAMVSHDFQLEGAVHLVPEGQVHLVVDVAQGSTHGRLRLHAVQRRAASPPVVLSRRRLLHKISKICQQEFLTLSSETS
jgi:hypothetical protein